MNARSPSAVSTLEIKFTISFYPQTPYIRSIRPFLNRTTIFELIVLGIELHLPHEETENKQKNTEIWVKTHELPLYSHEVH